MSTHSIGRPDAGKEATTMKHNKLLSILNTIMSGFSSQCENGSGHLIYSKWLSQDARWSVDSWTAGVIFFLSMLRAWAVLNCLISWVIVNDQDFG